MKKLISICLTTLMLFGLASCGNSSNEITTTTTTTTTQTTTDDLENESSLDSQGVDEEESTLSSESDNEEQNGQKTLVAYFSWSGNTQEVAKLIAQETDGDIFEITPKNSYPTDYTECTEVALEERDSGARPEISDLPQTIDEYDRIFIGYPIWWHTAPMIIGTFLESYDLEGVEIYPFSQSASQDIEQFNESVEFVKACAGNGNVHDGLFASYSETEIIKEYLSNI